MKAALLSEFALTKKILVQIALVYVIVEVAVSYGLESAVAGAASVAALLPFILLVTMFSYDDMNGWMRYRAMLPATRDDIVTARYLNIAALSLLGAVAAIVVAGAIAAITPLLGLPADLAGNIASGFAADALAASTLMGASAVSIVAAVIMPLGLRFGLTKTMRYLPVALFLVIILATNLPFSIPGLDGLFASADAWLERPGNLSLAGAASVVAAAIALAISCAVARVLFRSREL